MTGCPSGLDRAHASRRDEGWVQERLSDPSAHVVVVAGADLLATVEPPPRPLFLRPSELAARGIPLNNPVLLGIRDTTTYLAVGLETEHAREGLEGGQGAWVDLRKLGFLFETWEGDVVTLAKAMIHWNRRHAFCGDCGHPTRGSRGGFVRVCTNRACAREHFPRTDPAVIVLVTHDDEALLARQPTWTRGRYSAVAGFVEPAEALEKAACREVWEETGVQINNVRYRFSQAWPFPGTLMTAFTSTADDRAITRDEGELEDARWFSRDHLRRGLTEGTMSLPPPFAAGFCLIREWFDADGSDLGDIVARMPGG